MKKLKEILERWNGTFHSTNNDVVLFVYTSKMQYIIYIPGSHDLQSRKESKMVQKIQTELSINSNPARSQIQTKAYITGHLQDMFYDSKTQLIQFTDWPSSCKNPLNNLQTR